MIPALACLCLGDVGMLLFGGGTSAGVPFLAGIAACFAAFAASYGAIRLMRILVAKSSFEGLAYYSWGLAMFTYIIYLIR